MIYGTDHAKTHDGAQRRCQFAIVKATCVHAMSLSSRNVCHSHRHTSQSGLQWSGSEADFIIVQVVHTQLDCWQKHCPVTLYVTIDQSEVIVTVHVPNHTPKNHDDNVS